MDNIFGSSHAGVCFNFWKIELREDACIFLAAVEFIINYSHRYSKSEYHNLLFMSTLAAVQLLLSTSNHNINFLLIKIFYHIHRSWLERHI